MHRTSTPHALRTGMILGTLLALLLTLAPALRGRCEPLGGAEPTHAASAAQTTTEARSCGADERSQTSVHRGTLPAQERSVLVGDTWLHDLQGWLGSWLPEGPRRSSR